MAEAPILVFGASSQVGDAVLPALVAAGHGVLAVSRQPRRSAGPIRWIEGSCADGLIEAQPLVLSLGPLPPFAAWLGSRPAGSVRRVLALSSLSLRHKRDSANADERATAALLATGEAQTREAAAALGAELTLLRPALLYGADRDHSVARAQAFARRRGWLPCPWPATGLRQPLHVADLADALLQCLHGAAVGQTLELGGGERLSLSELLTRVAASVPGCRRIPLPAAPLKLAGHLLAPLWPPARSLLAALQRAQQDQLPDDQLTRQLLHWQPRPFEPV